LLDEVLKENIEAIKDAVMPVSNLSNPIYAYRDGDGAMAMVSVDFPNSVGQTNYSKRIKFGYDGVVKIEKDNSADNGEIIAENSIYLNKGFYRVSKETEIYLKLTRGENESKLNGGQIYVLGHTEFAPSLNLEIID
jgi:hypothetical protein